MNSHRSILNFIYENPWSTRLQIIDGTGLEKAVVDYQLKKHISAETRTERMRNGRDVVYYKLRDV